MKKIKFFLLAAILIAQLSFALPFDSLRLPTGFAIDIYAKVPGARQMALGKNGVVFVGTWNGKVYAVIPNDDLTKAKNVIVLTDHLDMPNGVAYHDNALYVAEVSRILRYNNVEKNFSDIPPPTILYHQLPTARAHGWRYIKFGPDDWLYIAIGMPCNICLPDDQRFGTLMRMKADGSHQEIYAKGLRNSVGFDWDPATKELWFTDNGRDWLGDHSPPDVLAHAPKQGLDFGFPYYYAGRIPDLHYSHLRSLKGITAPALDLPAHVAALGMTFYTGKMFPSAYRNQIFIAEHGSWNRSKKIGYQVIAITLKNNKVIHTQPFVRGWLQGQSAWGRPVDVLIMPDGALLISDDKAGVIYRVRKADHFSVSR